MDEFSAMPFVLSAEIHYGGLFGNIVKRHFDIDRHYGKIPARIIVQQYEMKRLDKQGVRNLITRMEYELEELREQLAGLEYRGN